MYIRFDDYFQNNVLIIIFTWHPAKKCLARNMKKKEILTRKLKGQNNDHNNDNRIRISPIYPVIQLYAKINDKCQCYLQGRNGSQNNQHTCGTVKRTEIEER